MLEVEHLHALCKLRIERRLPANTSTFIGAIIADNAPNYQGAGQRLVGDTFGCAAHSANLVVKYTIERVLSRQEQQVKVCAFWNLNLYLLGSCKHLWTVCTRARCTLPCSAATWKCTTTSVCQLRCNAVELGPRDVYTLRCSHPCTEVAAT